MAVKVPGSMAGFQFVKEATFGTTPTTAMKYGGHLRTLDTPFNPNADELEPDNSRQFSEVIFTNEDHGFNAELSIYKSVASGYSWLDLTELAIGANGTGVGMTLPSFSTLLKVASDQFFLMKGCMVNSFELSTEGVGKQIRATIDALCKRIGVPVASRPSGIGADAAKPTTAPLTYNKYPTSNIPNYATINAKNFTLNINNNLAPQEGFDTDSTPLSAGSGIIPGIVDIELTMESMSDGLYWDALKLNKGRDYTVVLSIDGYNLTLTGCYLPGGDMPSRSNTEPYDETITLKAKNITIIKAS